ncbi:MAG TPA: glyoxalase [Bacteroidia bacterium]|nr:glyoxalase [Bacteroidia bacterium]
MMPANIEVKTLRTFVPAKNYTISQQFYQHLGFELIRLTDDLSLCKAGIFEFILQNYYHKGWADNFMMHMDINNVDAWWDYLQSVNLEKDFKGIKLMPPVNEGWARVCRLIDPSGVLWHFSQYN